MVMGMNNKWSDFAIPVMSGCICVYSGCLMHGDYYDHTFAHGLSLDQIILMLGPGGWLALLTVIALVIRGVMKSDRVPIYLSLVVALAYAHWASVTEFASTPGPKIDIRATKIWCLLWIPFTSGVLALLADLAVRYRQQGRQAVGSQETIV